MEYIKEGELKPLITPVHSEDTGVLSVGRGMIIRFDCHVKMYDFGQRVARETIFSDAKPRPPQWFKLDMKITLDFLEHTDPAVVGLAIKDAYNKLKESIDNYER